MIVPDFVEINDVTIARIRILVKAMTPGLIVTSIEKTCRLGGSENRAID